MSDASSHLLAVQETHGVQVLEDVVCHVPELEDDGEAEDVLVLHLGVGRLLHLLDEAHPLLDSLRLHGAPQGETGKL